MTITIKVHTDTSLFDGFDGGDRPIDDKATLEAYSDAVFELLAAKYPDADLSVTHTARTSGGGSIEVLDEENTAVWDSRITDHVRELVGRVFEASDTWLRYEA